MSIAQGQPTMVSLTFYKLSAFSTEPEITTTDYIVIVIILTAIYCDAVSLPVQRPIDI